MLCLDSEDRLRPARRGGIAEPFILISHFVPFGHPRHPGWNLADFSRQSRWLDAREQCLGVITLSRYACEHARRMLGVRCDWVLHATEPARVRFSMDRFLAGSPRSLLMVGWWMRRFRTFCELRTPGYEKRILPGIFNGRSLEKALKSESCAEAAGAYVAARVATTTYDELLSRSIVFLDLFDASANNAVIECIARQTPILIRRLPAVVEYLGEDYPYYYDTHEEAESKLANIGLIEAAHEHLAHAAPSARVNLARFATVFSATTVYVAIDIQSACRGTSPTSPMGKPSVQT